MKRLLKFEKASGCVPCTMVQNILDEQNVVAEKINPFDDPKLAAEFNIGTVPTLIVLDGEGNEVVRSVGYNPNEIESIITLLKN